MAVDRITQIRIRGLRAIERLDLDLNGLVTLIGDNGAGKSCVIEAVEILRQASKPLSHVPDVIEKRHGGLRSLLRRGARELGLGVTVEGAGPKIVYDFAIGNVGTFPQVIRETIDAFEDGEAASPLHVLARDGRRVRVFDSLRQSFGLIDGGDEPLPSIGEQSLAPPWLIMTSQPAIRRLVDALGRIEVHAAFETRAVWEQTELGLNQGPRWPSMLESAGKLERYGLNLPNAFQTLRNRGNGVWNRVLERAKLGLGDDLRDFSLTPFGRGQVGLEVLFGAFPDAPLPAESLSEGQLAYLCFVALFEFQAESSLLVFDEPEGHLHPQLLARVAGLFEEAAVTAPIIVATHSDRFLDSLSDPASSVVLCDLDEARATQLRRVDRQRLEEWLRDYRGIGAIRAEGYQEQVFLEVTESAGVPAA